MLIVFNRILTIYIILIKTHVSFSGGKLKPVKKPKKQSKDLDEVKNKGSAT